VTLLHGVQEDEGACFDTLGLGLPVLVGSLAAAVGSIAGWRRRSVAGLVTAGVALSLVIGYVVLWLTGELGSHNAMSC
jgi:hypothetical protein